MNQLINQGRRNQPTNKWNQPANQPELISQANMGMTS
jgi:hypothetical protein